MIEDFTGSWNLIAKLPKVKGRVRDLKGDVFGRLTVVKRHSLYHKPQSDAWGNALWVCQCECGKPKITTQANLRRGRVKSCGCLQQEYRHSSKISES